MMMQMFAAYTANSSVSHSAKMPQKSMHHASSLFSILDAVLAASIFIIAFIFVHIVEVRLSVLLLMVALRMIYWKKPMTRECALL